MISAINRRESCSFIVLAFPLPVESTVGLLVRRVVAMHKVPGSKSLSDKNCRYSNFVYKWAQGVPSGALVLTQHLNGDYNINPKNGLFPILVSSSQDLQMNDRLECEGLTINHRNGL